MSYINFDAQCAFAAVSVDIVPDSLAVGDVAVDSGAKGGCGFEYVQLLCLMLLYCVCYSEINTENGFNAFRSYRFRRFNKQERLKKTTILYAFPKF